MTPQIDAPLWIAAGAAVLVWIAAVVVEWWANRRRPR